jgi:hypothetical protein
VLQTLADDAIGRILSFRPKTTSLNLVRAHLVTLTMLDNAAHVCGVVSPKRWGCVRAIPDTRSREHHNNHGVPEIPRYGYPSQAHQKFSTLSALRRVGSVATNPKRDSPTTVNACAASISVRSHMAVVLHRSIEDIIDIEGSY